VNHDIKVLLTLDEVADTLRCAKSTIYELMSSGELPYLKIRGLRRIEAGELEGFIERHRIGPRAPSFRLGRKGTNES
jgi:excisionase family DNA binding protein